MRFVQGLSISGMVLNVRAIAADMNEGKDLRKVMIYITTAWLLSPVIGPAIGGYFQTYLGWHAGFYFLAIYAAILLILIARSLPETNQHRHAFHLKTLAKNYKIIGSSWAYMRNVLGLGLAFSAFNVFNILGPFILQVQLHKSPWES